MDKITGYLIRYHRLQQNLSQEGLCKGICVISYLSKIEQGKADADPVIVHALFHQLNRKYYDDSVLMSQYKDYLHAYFEHHFMDEDTAGYAEKIKKQREKLLCSPLFLSYLLFELYEDMDTAKVDKDLQELSSFEAYMTEEQLFLYDLAYAQQSDHELKLKYLKKADKLKQCSITQWFLGVFYAEIGQYSEALQSHQKALVLANEEGMFHISALVMISIGNHYANMGVEQLMHVYYKKAMTAARAVRQDDLLKQVYYNLGATYEEWGHHEQAIHYLEKAISKQRHQNFMIYHKLSFAYCHIGNMGKAKEAYAQLKACYQDDFKEGAMLLCEIVRLYLQEDHLEDPCYQQVLENICFKKHLFIFHGVAMYHAQYLIELYIHHRKYKEALKLVNMRNDKTFSF